MKSLKKELAIVASVFAFGLTGCGNITDSSLLSDSATDYSSNAISKTPNAGDLNISSNSVNLSIPVANTKIELSGNCSASTYANHYIEALYANQVRGIVDLNSTLTAATANKATCKNGRFALALNISGWAAGQYIFVLRMTAFNDPATLVTNDVSGRFQFTLTKY
jgi:hypothetical protein